MRRAVRGLGPVLLLVAAAWLMQAMQAMQVRDGGRTLVFALAIGLAMGGLLQRTRFCFYCHARDWFERRDARGLLAIVLALAIGLVGHTVVLGSWVANPLAGQLPPDMHIGPVSWVLALAGMAFGLGMLISGSCISAHWYRLAEGSVVSPFALVGTALGFLLGFQTWNPLYSLAVADAPVVWLPAQLGYGGALLVQLTVLAAISAGLWHGHVKQQQRQALNTPSPQAQPAAARVPWPTLAQLWSCLWQGRWASWVGGLGVGLLCTLAIVRMRPLGVTATLGSATRQAGTAQGWVPERLNGLDGFAGCATLPSSSWLTPNALVLVGLLLGAFAAGMASAQFQPRRVRAGDVVRGLGGGLLLGWGAMTGLGCTVGTLLSGTMAGALSGWVFGLALFATIGVGLHLKQRWAPRV